MENKIVKIEQFGVNNPLHLIDKEIITMRKAANVVNQKGLGRNRLYKLLRVLEYIEFIGKKNYAIQKHIDEGYFVNIDKKRSIRGGKGYTNQVYVTQKGLELIKKLVDEYIVI